MNFDVIVNKNRILPNKELQDFLNTIENNTVLELNLVPKGKVRNNSQNAYYWTLIGEISKVIGESKDKTHDLMVYKFLGEYKEKVFGQEITQLPSTSKLSKKEFAEFVNAVLNWAIEFLQIKIPSSN